MILDLVRHAGNGRDEFLDGRSDPPQLAGLPQELVEAYAGQRWERVISSPRLRALHTAMALATPRGLDVEADEEWEELDFGDWDGRSLFDLPEDALAAFHADPHAFPPPNGESWGHFERRIARALDRLLDDDDPVPTLVVSHGGPLRMVLSQVCGLPMSLCWALRIDHGTRLRVWLERGEIGLVGELLAAAALSALAGHGPALPILHHTGCAGRWPASPGTRRPQSSSAPSGTPSSASSSASKRCSCTGPDAGPAAFSGCAAMRAS